MLNDEWQQLEESVCFGSSYEGDPKMLTVDPASFTQLLDEYQAFVDLLPDSFDVTESCLVMGDEYEQFAHDYIMTRMGHGVGFWEDSDWEATDGRMLTDLCGQQGTIETIVEDDVVFIC